MEESSLVGLDLSDSKIIGWSGFIRSQDNGREMPRSSNGSGSGKPSAKMLFSPRETSNAGESSRKKIRRSPNGVHPSNFVGH